MFAHKEEIVIIQGDTCQKNVSISGVMLSNIDSVYFSCAKLNITKQLEYDETISKFVFYLTPEETSSLKPIVTDFDITVKFNTSTIKTGVYRGKIMVLEKNNSVEVL